MTESVTSFRTRRGLSLVLGAVVALVGCDRSSSPRATTTRTDDPSPRFRNVDSPTAYVGDAACATCHAAETSAYRQHAMSQSFHRWTPATRIETTLDTPLLSKPTGLSYSVVEAGHQLYQVEFLTGPGGKRLHELRRRIDFVMGSGHVGQTYFTEENGRLFQLPLTWYREAGWDFSPGYQVNNARFDRLLPDRCLACHASYPKVAPFLEGKYAELREGIGCERCHGPGALHVTERRAGVQRDAAFDGSIVNPARMPLERRLDSCEQCHVHTAVTVLRSGKDHFSYMPSQPLRDQFAFFKARGGIDIVSHADRLRQSKCFIASRATSRPLECATCHNPHAAPPDAATRNQPCSTCHVPAVLAQRLARSESRALHTPSADCVSCHMPRVQVRRVLHGAFTDHWIRVAVPGVELAAAPRQTEGPIEPFYDRDKTGPEADVYKGMGGIVYATLANSSRALGDAAAELDRALAGDTTRGDANFLLGVAYQQLGRTDDAIRALEPSVRADSNRPDRLRALAQAYDHAGRTPSDIGHLYQRALALQPALAWIRADYADFLQGQGLRSESEQAYRAALAEQPSLAVTRFNLGTLLADEGRMKESAEAFRDAAHLDPALANATLLRVRITKQQVTGVVRLGSVLPSLSVRDHGLSVVQLAVSTGAPQPGVQFLNAPPRATVQILKPDGTLVRALSAVGGQVPSWDLLTDAGHPIAGGLYRARVQGSDARGRVAAAELLYFGVVHQRVE